MGSFLMVECHWREMHFASSADLRTDGVNVVNKSAKTLSSFQLIGQCENIPHCPIFVNT